MAVGRLCVRFNALPVCTDLILKHAARIRGDAPRARAVSCACILSALAGSQALRSTSAAARSRDARATRPGGPHPARRRASRGCRARGRAVSRVRAARPATATPPDARRRATIRSFQCPRRRPQGQRRRARGRTTKSESIIENCAQLCKRSHQPVAVRAHLLFRLGTWGGTLSPVVRA